MIRLLFALLAPPDTTTLLVDVLLSESQERVLVEAKLRADSTLLLPATPVHQLLGIGAPTLRWLTVAQLQAQYPTTHVVWRPLELRVVILDPMRVFPASRRAHAVVVARSQWALGLPIQSQPYFALSWDDRAVLIDAGYSWRGRLAFGGRVDNNFAGLWHVTASPSSHLFVSYQGGVGIPPAVQGRIAAGPIWLAGSYSPHRPVDLAGLLHVGPVQLFASPDFGVITLQPDARVSVQLARTWETKRTAARISFGPTFASPFSFPVTSLSPRR